MYNSYEYRVVKRTDQEWHGIYCVYFDEKGEIVDWFQEHLVGFGFEDLQDECQKAQEAFSKPVLHLSELLTVSTEEAEQEVQYGEQLELNLDA